MPMMFHRGERPASAASAPAASGGLARERRPSASSATTCGVAIRTQARMNTRMKALPPPVPARNGNRHTLPSPTAAPDAARYTENVEDQSGVAPLELSAMLFLFDHPS